MKITDLWVVAPCSLVKFIDVSDALVASIIKAKTVFMVSLVFSRQMLALCLKIVRVGR
jgi:hypothetical protein